MANSAINTSFTQYPNTIENNLGWFGKSLVGIAGEALTFGDFVRYNFTTSKWYKAKADIYTNARCDGLWIEVSTDPSAYGALMTEGVARNDDWNWTATALWLSPTTAGTATGTQPVTSGQMLQYVAMAINSDTIFFNPSNDIGEIL